MFRRFHVDSVGMYPNPVGAVYLGIDFRTYAVGLEVPCPPDKGDSGGWGI